MIKVVFNKMLRINLESNIIQTKHAARSQSLLKLSVMMSLADYQTKQYLNLD